MATHPAQRIENAHTADGVLSRAALQLRQFMCGLHGHDSLLHFEEGRISLLCTSCGYESPGWEVNGVPPASEVTDSKTHVVSMPLVEERRVA